MNPKNTHHKPGASRRVFRRRRGAAVARDLERIVEAGLGERSQTQPERRRPAPRPERVHEASPRKPGPTPHLRTGSRNIEVKAVTWWRLGWLLAAAGVLVGVGAGGPVLGRSGWTILWLVVGASLAAGGAALALEGYARAGGLTQAGRAFPVGVAAFVMVATLGLVTTPVIGGRPVLTNSQEAQLAEFAETMIDRLYKLGEIDELMALDQVQGRLHTTTLEAHYLEVERWAVEYAAMKPEDLAVPELSEPHLSMEQTVDQALAAIDQHLRWLKTGDPVAHRMASEHRQAMASGVLRTGRLIGEVAFNYGVPVGEHEGGLVE